MSVSWLIGLAVLCFPSLRSAPRLHVHVVPHTHDDLGWLKTVDEYYTGANNSIAHANVRSILDTVIDALWRDESKRFVYAEVGYFYRWWRQQSAQTQRRVHQMVHEGRLEFVNGGKSLSQPIL